MMESRNKVSTTHRTTACEACKRRRTKCQGHPTCFKCREFQTDCIFQPQHDKRKKSALKEATDKIDDLDRLIEDIVQAYESEDQPRLEQLIAQHKNGRAKSSKDSDADRSPVRGKRRRVDSVSISDETLHRLQDQHRKLSEIHETLQNCNVASLPFIIDGIQKDFTVQDAATSIDRGVPWKSPAMTLDRIQAVMTSGLAKQPGLLHKEPPYRVTNIGRWTSVVTDEVASHLFSIYFTWEVWHLVEAKIFLRDLNAGQTEFCSPLLVNAVLCVACNYSYDIGKPWDRSEERSIANKLFAEVERLWQVEKSEICVTTVQASLVLGLLLCGAGKDKIGCIYVEYGARMAHRLGLHQWSSHVYLQDLETDMERTRAYKVIAWGTFEAQGVTTQLCRKTPVWREPPAISFSEQEAADADKNRFWTPYPFTSPIHEDLLHTRIWASSQLFTTANDIAAFVLEVPDGPLLIETWQAGANLHDRLLFFKSCLPPELHLNWNKTPQNICMYLHYYATVINLCEVLDSHPLDIAFFDDPGMSSSFDPRQSLNQAMNSMGSLILLYRACHGWKSLPCIMEHYFCVTGVHAASRAQTSEQWSSILGACVSGLWHMSLGWRLSRPFLRMIQVILMTAKHDQSCLPQEVVKIFQELNAKVWNMAEIASLSADYVVHQVPHELPLEGKPVQRTRSEGIETLILSLEESKI